MEIRIFFDLDGVLADMEGGLRQNPENSATWRAKRLCV